MTPEFDLEVALISLDNVQGFVLNMGDMFEQIQKYHDDEPSEFPWCEVTMPLEELSIIGNYIKAMKELKNRCIHCDKDTAPGKGNFADRIPVLDAFDERLESFDYPMGEYICAECESDFYKENGCSNCQGLSFNNVGRCMACGVINEDKKGRDMRRV
jgi:hypothetical protein